VNLIGQKKLTNICLVKPLTIMTEVFLDTSFAIALSSVTDRNHLRAVQLANQIETNKTRLVTTQAILLEIGNALSKQRYRAAAIQLLESLETDPSVQVILLTNSLYRLAFNLFKQREDKECSNSHFETILRCFSDLEIR
jgi:predicted nucleic acid-binding protein